MSDSVFTPLTGGCLCGAVRYSLHSAPTDAGYCHCRTCRHSAGAPVLAFASVPVADFRMTGAEPGRYRSSARGERWFCAACGTQVAMRVDDDLNTVDFTLGSLDEPASVVPGFHIWDSRRAPWFAIGDDLPRYPRSRAEGG